MIVTFGGDQVVAWPVTLIVAAGAWAPATLAVNRPVQMAMANTITADVIRRMSLSPIPLLPAKDAAFGVLACQLLAGARTNYRDRSPAVNVSGAAV